MQTILPFHHQPSYCEEDFLVSPANEDAYQWIKGDHKLWHNGTLALWGEAGSGKTHLATIWARHHHAIFLTPDTLIEMMHKANELTPPMWVLDNVERVLHHNIDEATLFHLLNIITQNNGRLLLTAQHAPARWDITLKDLSSRLHAVSSVALNLPDEALMKALLLKLFSDRQLIIHDDVADYIITRIERNFEALQTIVALLDHASLRQKRNITTPLAREIINNLASSAF